MNWLFDHPFYPNQALSAHVVLKRFLSSPVPYLCEPQYKLVHSHEEEEEEEEEKECLTVVLWPPYYIHPVFARLRILLAAAAAAVLHSSSSAPAANEMGKEGITDSGLGPRFPDAIHIPRFME